MKAKETTIVTTVEITQITNKRFPVNKKKGSYEKDAKVLLNKIFGLINVSQDEDLKTIQDIKISTNENGELSVQVFTTEVILDEC